MSPRSCGNIDSTTSSALEVKHKDDATSRFRSASSQRPTIESSVSIEFLQAKPLPDAAWE